MKKFLTKFMVAALLASTFAGCGNSEVPQQEDPVASKVPGESALENESTASADNDSAGDEDIAQINILFWTLNTIPGDLEMVEAAINEITREKINTEVHLEIVDMGSYAQQVNLRVSSNEKLDLIVTLPGETAHFNAMTSQNQLLGISNLLKEYAPELLEIVPEEWIAGTTVDGEIYSVTSYGDKATPLCFVCRTDILEQTGMDPSTIKNANDFTELFSKVKEAAPEMIPLCGGNRGFLTAPYMIDADGNFFSYEALGEGNNSIISIIPGNGSTITDRYETDEYKSTTDWVHQWYEAGYVDRDLANKNDTAESVIQAGTGFGFFKLISGGEYGDTAISQSVGYDMTVIEICESVIDTLLIRKFTWAVPQCATEPEAAVKFLNLLYTDKEVLNLLTWGIEDVHYQTLEDGTIDFIDGEDASTCGYYLGDVTAILGNGFLAKVRTGQPANYREECLKLNQEAALSEFIGFGIDNTGLENTLTALTNVINEMRPVFSSGIEGSDKLDGFIEKMKSADVDSYVAAMQEQLDAWLAKNQ